MSDTYTRGDTDARGDAYSRGGSDGRAAAYGRDQRPARLGAYAREQMYVGLKTRDRGDGKERTGTAGRFIIAFVALFSAVVVIIGLAYAAGDGERRRVLLAQGDCAPVASLNTRGLDCTLESQLASQYTQMTTPVGKQMATYAGAYAASEFHNLPAAEGILTAEVAAENSLDASLKQFTFPPVFASATNKLIADNEAATKLTARQAQSSSLAQLQSFDSRVQAAIAAVRTDLTLVGQDLAKPPTPSEYIGNGG
jgi:hypothetical protein